jgi:hypothetical protein
MAVPKWLDGKSPQVRGRKFEKKLAKKVGGRVQPGSGAFPFYKEDVVTADCLMQLKQTDKTQYAIHLKDLTELCVNAAKVGKRPLFVLHMGGRSWGIVPLLNLE